MLTSPTAGLPEHVDRSRLARATLAPLSPPALQTSIEGARRFCRVVGVAALMAMSTVACGSDPDAIVVAAEVVERLSILKGGEIDILFVVDNSGSMCEEQLALREYLVEFIDPLIHAQADLHVAVITTDMENPEQSGRFQNVPAIGPDTVCGADIDINGCPSPDDGGAYPPLILRSQDSRYWDASGDVDADRFKRELGCSLRVGTLGSDAAMGLEAARVALSTLRDGYNSGFFREPGVLVVVFVSNSDDCSQASDSPQPGCKEQDLIPLQDFTEFFSTLKRNGANTFVPIAIVGPAGEETCSSDLGEADPAPRYHALIDAFPINASTSVCEPPFSEAVVGYGPQDRVDVACLRYPMTCESDRECRGQGRCEPRGEPPRGVCSTFSVQIEIERQPSSPPIPERECRLVRPNEDHEDVALRCTLVDGIDYIINYDSDTCESGVEVWFSHRPRFLDQDVLIRYPRRLGGSLDD